MSIVRSVARYGVGRPPPALMVVMVLPIAERDPLQRSADLRQVLQVGARADVHVQPGNDQVVASGETATLAELLVPDAVLRLFAAGVGLLAVAVAKARIDPQGDLAAGRTLAELVDHVGRAAIDVDSLLDDQVERLVVEDVGRVNDRRRVAGGQ